MFQKKKQESEEHDSKKNEVNAMKGRESEQIVRVLLDIDSKYVTYTDVQMGETIWKLSAMIESRDPLFIYRGIIMNPRRTFSSYHVAENDRINVISFDPMSETRPRDVSCWTRLDRISDDARVRSVYHDYLFPDLARLNDLRFSKRKSIRINLARGLASTKSNNYETVIPARSDSPNEEPIGLKFDKDDI